MSLWSRPTGSGWTDPDGRVSGEDVAGDAALASNRDTGDEHTDLTGDPGSVTGTGRTGEFVGRTAGDDLGHAGETGAERRAEAERGAEAGDGAHP
ncbi:hypothetical protein I4J48_14385 [Pseudonocardia sp. KRD-169]|uniref:Uncharacterized protein n=2 Tax=Pseudonocardia abyssalis TaxID=2792008 RepID=A0ABS6UR47_9PSEU|nr:hypothetical protein [Pseudonocardia abyssalis]MBW0134738.1 hypothetical protein [Pseudonocardia abyssalis]